MGKIKPITPKEINKIRHDTFPDEVIEAFNDLIVKYWDGNQAKVLQKDAVAEIVRRSDLTSEELVDKHYLDVEGIFRKAGWNVKYDGPAYCENYDAFYVFKKKL